MRDWSQYILRNLQAKAVALACFLILCSTHVLAQIALVGTPPVLISGTKYNGLILNPTTTVTLRNLGSPLYASQLKSLPEAFPLFSCCKTAPPLVFNFEVLNGTTNEEHGSLQVAGFADKTEPLGDFLSGEDHAWRVYFLSSSIGVLGTYNYRFVLRAYDTACSIARGGFLIHPACVVYELPLQTSTMTWIKAPPLPSTPPPPPSQPVYPMINNRPYGEFPPSSIPRSTFLTCTQTGCR